MFFKVKKNWEGIVILILFLYYIFMVIKRRLLNERQNWPFSLWHWQSLWFQYFINLFISHCSFGVNTCTKSYCGDKKILLSTSRLKIKSKLNTSSVGYIWIEIGKKRCHLILINDCRWDVIRDLVPGFKNDTFF